MNLNLPRSFLREMPLLQIRYALGPTLYGDVSAGMWPLKVVQVELPALQCSPKIDTLNCTMK